MNWGIALSGIFLVLLGIFLIIPLPLDNGLYYGPEGLYLFGVLLAVFIISLGLFLLREGLRRKPESTSKGMTVFRFQKL